MHFWAHELTLLTLAWRCIKERDTLIGCLKLWLVRYPDGLFGRFRARCLLGAILEMLVLQELGCLKRLHQVGLQMARALWLLVLHGELRGEL